MMHDTSLQRLCALLARMMHNSVPHVVRQIQPGAFALQKIDNAKTLLVVREMAAKFRHRRLARMTERRMPDVMAERNRLDKILVQPKSPGNRPRNLRNLKAVRHSCTVMVARHDINLRLVLHTSK